MDYKTTVIALIANYTLVICEIELPVLVEQCLKV